MLWNPITRIIAGIVLPTDMSKRRVCQPPLADWFYSGWLRLGIPTSWIGCHIPEQTSHCGLALSQYSKTIGPLWSTRCIAWKHFRRRNTHTTGVNPCSFPTTETYFAVGSISPECPRRTLEGGGSLWDGERH